MELHHLKYLVALAECGTVSKAATSLHISQPALTRSIQKLENELDCLLFDRINNRLVLNDSGKVVIKRARKILKQKEKMLADLKIYQQSKQQINIGACAPAPLWGLYYILKQQEPNKILNTSINNNSQALLTGLKNHQYSIIIIDHPVDNRRLKSIALFKESLYLAVTNDHPLATKKELTFQEIDGTAILQLSNTGYWYDLCKTYLPNSALLEQEDLETYDILKNTTSLAVFRTNITLPKYQEQENRIYIPIIDQEASLTFYAVYHKENASLYHKIPLYLASIPWLEFNRDEVIKKEDIRLSNSKIEA